MNSLEPFIRHELENQPGTVPRNELVFEHTL